MPSITFDGPNKIIEIGYDSATTEVTVSAIYSRWKDWVQSDNAQYQPAFDLSVGGNPLGAGLNLDGYFFLRNDLGWRVRAADQDHVLIIDGQMFGFATGTGVYLARPGRSITYREVQSSRSQVVNPAGDAVTAASGFQGGVWVHTSSAFSGTTYPTGTSVEPVNNIADAVTIANTYGLREILLLDSVTLNEDVSYFTIRSKGSGVGVTVNSAANVLHTTFDGVDVNGYFDGPAHISNGDIAEILDGFVGDIHKCHISTGIVCIGDVSIADSYSGVAWQGGAYLDYDGLVLANQIRNWSGTISVRNMVAGATLSVNLGAGRVVIEASCTGGSIKVVGVGEPIQDNSGGAVTIDEDGLIYAQKVVDGTVPYILGA